MRHGELRPSRALTATPAEGSATGLEAPEFTRNLVDPGGVVPADPRNGAFPGEERTTPALSERPTAHAAEWTVVKASTRKVRPSYFPGLAGDESQGQAATKHGEVAFLEDVICAVVKRSGADLGGGASGPDENPRARLATRGGGDHLESVGRPPPRGVQVSDDRIPGLRRQALKRGGEIERRQNVEPPTGEELGGAGRERDNVLARGAGSSGVLPCAYA